MKIENKKSIEQILILLDAIPILTKIFCASNKVVQNNLRLERIRKSQELRPIESALSRLSVAWDDVNNTFASGNYRDFKWKLQNLKSLCSRLEPIIGSSRLRKFREEHPDRAILNEKGKVVRIEHGYNFNYKS